MWVKKERITAGADARHGNPLFFYACVQKDPSVCLPQIKLIFPIWFLIKKFIPVFFFKCFFKLFNHIFADFITVLTDRRTDGCVKFWRVCLKFLSHFFHRHFTDLSYRTSPSGMWESYRFMYRIYKEKRYTVRIKGCQHQSWHIGDHSIHIRIRPRFCDSISPVCFRDHMHIGGMCLIRSYDISHGKSHSIRESAVIFPHYILVISSCKA